MRIVIFAADESVHDIFTPLQRSSGVALEYMHHDDIRTWVKSGHSADMMYLDARELSARDLGRLVKRLVQSDSGALAVFDVDNEVEDIGSLFFEGICDYLGSVFCDRGLRKQRVESALRLHHRMHHSAQTPQTSSLRTPPARAQHSWNGRETPKDFPSEARAIPRLIPSHTDWSLIQSGEEYTFGLLYVGIDLADSVRKDTRPELVRDSLSAFQAALREVISPFNGMLWFWKDTAGVVLFPFDGTNSDAVTGTIKVYLHGMFWQAENRTNYLTEQYRLALHVGNVVFEDGARRETLVSDTINYLFHLGSMHTEPGSFIATEPILSRCPEGFRHCFVASDSFKGVKTWRMRRILQPA
ncbi:MAG: hypothetical protein ACLFNQ_10260 [Spirochaetaceae bacterium]